MEETSPSVISELTDPVELAELRIRREHFARNSAWLQAHVPEIYSLHRGKCICVADEELFVADTPGEIWAWAKAIHPEDKGPLVRYIPKEKGLRILCRGRAIYLQCDPGSIEVEIVGIEDVTP